MRRRKRQETHGSSGYVNVLSANAEITQRLIGACKPNANLAQGNKAMKGTSWAVVIFLGRDAGGKQHRRWHAVRGTDAQRELARLMNEINTGAPTLSPLT